MNSDTRVFVSYVQENADVVTRLVRDLRAHGLNVWFDRDTLAPGMFWRDEVRTAVQNHEYFLACFSREYNERQRTYMNEELELAVAEIRLRDSVPWFIPILLSGEVPDRQIGAGRTLRDIQFVSLTDQSWNPTIRQLVATLRGRATSRLSVAGQLQEDSTIAADPRPILSAIETNVNDTTLRSFLDHNALATKLDATIALFTGGFLHEASELNIEAAVERLRQARISTIEALGRALMANEEQIIYWARKQLAGKVLSLPQGICLTYLYYVLAYPGPPEEQLIEFVRTAHLFGDEE